jgi:hypothetical protein
MTDVSWAIETADYGTLTASGVLGDTLPTFGVGDEVTLTFLFGQDVPNHVDHYDDLREFGRYSNDSTIDTGTDIRGKPWYRPRRHPESSFTSALVKLVPSSNVGHVRNYWAVVTDVVDQTRFVGAGERLAVTCFVLAEGSEYSTRSDVEDDLEADL